jgi:hypothetical protein
MNPIIMAVPSTEKTERLQISVHVQAEVLAAEVARRRANVWLLEHIGNLLRAESPELVLGERLVWRVEVMLTSPSRGRVGLLGRLELDAITGDVLADESLAEELLPRAQALTAN